MAGSRPESATRREWDGVRRDQLAVLLYPVAFPPALVPHTVAQGIILACWGIFIVVWILAAFTTKRTIERSSNWWWRVLVIAVIASFVARRGPGGGAPYGALGGTLWTATGAVGAIAAVVVILGLVIALWARAVLSGNWSANVTFKAGHELIERGPYRSVRHPIYSGLLLMVLGTAILAGRVGLFVLFVILFVGFWIKLRAEERLLTRHFPDAYPAYRRRVKALVPFVL